MVNSRETLDLSSSEQPEDIGEGKKQEKSRNKTNVKVKKKEACLFGERWNLWVEAGYVESSFEKLMIRSYFGRSDTKKGEW